VDGLRNYPEEPEQRWYSDRYRTEGDDRYDGYRVPDPRYEEPRGWGLEQTSPPSSSRIGSDPVSEPDRYHTQALNPPPPPPAPPSMVPPMSVPPTSGAPGSPAPVQAVPPQAAAAEPGGAVYRARRAGVAALLAAAAVVAELLLVRVLLVAEFSSKGTPGGVLAGLFGLAGVPLVTMGLHGLITGAASAGSAPGRLWLRLPLAYLPVGLLLLLAAALAVSP
jgi:hypothetical protein